MRYPEFLKDRGTIGFVAPSMGCTTEPYRSAFDNAIKRFHSMGYKTIEGPNCRCDSGIGISNTPKKCAEELNESYASADSDVLISCGGGELMCEVVPYIDFERVKQSKPKWYGLFRQHEFHIFGGYYCRYSRYLRTVCGQLWHGGVA